MFDVTPTAGSILRGTGVVVIMESKAWWPPSLGGGFLTGDRIVRMAYLDESGVAQDEPFLVVAGTILDADRQWRVVQKYLHELRDEFIPEGRPKGRIFHATDIFHGSKHFTRSAWSQELRYELLEKLVSIPDKFDLPIVCGVVRKDDLPPFYVQRKTPAKISESCQAMSFNFCSISVDRWMKLSAEPDEVALIIAEDRPEVRTIMRGMLRFAQNPPDFLLQFLHDDERPYLPLTSIVDTVHFAGKMDSSPLQIADACAFAIMRYLRRGKDSERFYAHIKKRLAFKPRMKEFEEANLPIEPRS